MAFSTEDSVIKIRTQARDVGDGCKKHLFLQIHFTAAILIPSSKNQVRVNLRSYLKGIKGPSQRNIMRWLYYQTLISSRRHAFLNVTPSRSGYRINDGV